MVEIETIETEIIEIEDNIVPKECAITGKKARTGKTYSFLRSHYNPTGKRTFGINLQRITAIIDGVKQKITVSTKALKTFPALKSGISSKELLSGRKRRKKKATK